MRTTHIKLAAALSGLLLSLTMVVVGTFAWFTVSTKPEIGGINVSLVSTGSEFPFELCTDYREEDPNSGHWTTELHVDDLLKNCELRPITTYDGRHWYLADYAPDGSVVGFAEVPLSTVANRAKREDSAAENSNCLVYFDMYVRTRDENTGYYLRLNNPGLNDDNTLHVEDSETVYGTFLLSKPVFDDVNNKALAPADAGMTSARIGFAVYDESGEYTDENNEKYHFFIYEPNANLRSDFAEADQYNEMKRYDYLYGYGANHVGGYSSAAAGILTTLVPKYKPLADGEIGLPYEIVEQAPDFIQEKSAWNTTKLAGITNAADLSNVDSTYLQSVGGFVKYNADQNRYDPQAYQALTALAALYKGDVQRIRVYLWLEGQDPDCWNQIIGGGIYANLEFRGDPAPAEEALPGTPADPGSETPVTGPED